MATLDSCSHALKLELTSRHLLNLVGWHVNQGATQDHFFPLCLQNSDRVGDATVSTWGEEHLRVGHPENAAQSQEFSHFGDRIVVRGLRLVSREVPALLDILCQSRLSFCTSARQIPVRFL